MSLLPEVWQKDITETLYASSAIMSRFTDDSKYANVKTVHIPNSGGANSIVVDPSSFPLTVSNRTDSEMTYDLNQLAILPVNVTNLEEIQLSYDKRQSVLGQGIAALGEVATNRILYNVYPSGATNSIIRSTGATSSNSLAPSATGYRNAVTLSDIARLAGILTSQNVPDSGRVMCVPSTLYYNDFLAIANLYQAQSYGSPVLPTGVINKVHGFDVYVRSAVVVTDNSTVPAKKSINTSGTPSSPAATDNLAILAFHPAFVSKAISTVKVLADIDSPMYLGTVINAFVVAGGSNRYKLDSVTGYVVGVCALVQGQ